MHPTLKAEIFALMEAKLLASRSFDKGFTCAADRDLLSLYVPTVVMPKRGKKSAAETAREREQTFATLVRTFRGHE